MTVDLYGQCADADPIAEACARHGVALIEDAAEALGARYRGRPAGSLAPIGVFSFNGNKVITTSGGGMLVSDDGDLVARARYLATQARQPAPHYEHTEAGFNYRLEQPAGRPAVAPSCGPSTPVSPAAGPSGPATSTPWATVQA